MDRDIPSFNRAVMERIYAKNHELHLKRLKNIKTGISSNKSYQKTNYPSLNNPNYIVNSVNNYKYPQYNNLKKEVMQDVKNAQIQRQNALLFKKMIRIMKRPDINNDPNAPRYNATMNSAKQRISIEFSKINQQNKAFYHRLEQQKPTIDSKKLQQQRLKNLNILKFLGKYPNQEAAYRSSQYKTFQMKSQKMNSTSNRIRDKCIPSYSHQDQTNDQQKYNRFKNQIQLYDHQITQLKKEQQKANKNSEKMALSTAYQFYPRKSLENQQLKLYKGHYGSNTLKQQQDEPSLPDRKRFSSQGGNRKTMYEEKFINPINNLGSTFKQQSDHNFGLEPYPCKLNHPSLNIVIQERNSQYRNKKNFVQNIKESRSINNQILQTGLKPSFNSQQRKLNSTNSKSNIHADEEPSIQPQQQFYHEKKFNSPVKQEDEENQSSIKFAFQNQNYNPQNINLSRNSNTDNEKNYLHSQENYYKHDHVQKSISKKQNRILLYKKFIQLSSLMIKEQKLQLLHDISLNPNYQMIFKTSQKQINVQLLDTLLAQYTSQMSIYRLSDCYKITFNNKVGFQSLKKNKKYEQKSENNPKSSQIYNSIKSFDPALVELIRSSIQQNFRKITELEIPQEEGSFLLEQIDYDYKLFINEMVKIQKAGPDCNGLITQPNYRIVIVFKEEQIKINPQDEIQPEIHQLNSNTAENLNQEVKLVNSQQNQQEQPQNQIEHKESEINKLYVKQEMIVQKNYIVAPNTQQDFHINNNYEEALQQEVL